MRFTQLLTNLILEQSRFQVLYDKMVKPAHGSDAEGKKAKGLMPFEVLKNIIFAFLKLEVQWNIDVYYYNNNKNYKSKVKYSQTCPNDHL